MLSYVGQCKPQVSSEGRRLFDQALSRHFQVPAVRQPLVIAHMVGPVLASRQLGARGVALMGDAFGGELDGVTFILKISQQLSANLLQRAGWRIRSKGETQQCLILDFTSSSNKQNKSKINILQLDERML